MSKSIALCTIFEKRELIELGWLWSIFSKGELDILFPSGVSSGLLSLDPLFVGSWHSLAFLLRGTWGLTNLGKSITGNSGWVLKSDIVAVNIDTVATSWVLGDESFVLVHGWWNIIVLMIIDVTAETNFTLWYWSAEVTTSLLVSLLVCCLDEGVVVHNWMPESKFHIADELQDSIELLLRNPFSLSGKEGTITHAGGNGVSMEHTSW